MRLQLIAAALIAIGTAAPATGDPAAPSAATATFRVYADDDHVTVVSPGARVNAWLGASTTLAVDTTIDVVTGASVDVLSAASPSTVHERRIELGTTVTRVLPVGAATSASLGLRGSHEHDYDAVRAIASARTELAERNTTIDLRYTLGHDVARAVTDPMFRRTRDSQQLTATVSQLVDRRTVADLIVDGGRASGYHASPYRQVRVELPSSPLPLLVTEQTPARRATLAVAGRLRRALGAHTFASGTYRFYGDDWSVTSHTVSVEGLHQIAERWLVGVLVRGYVQDGAAFYRARYRGEEDAPALRTADRTLGPMRSLFVSSTADLTVRADWHVVLAIGVLGSWFSEFPAQAERRALITTASLTAPL